MDLNRLMSGTNTIEDHFHELRAQQSNCIGEPIRFRITRHFTMRNNKMANAALERAKALKAKKEGKIASKTSTAIKTRKDIGKKPGADRKTRSTSSDIPWQQIANDYNNGLSTKEIAEKHDLVRPKTKNGKENPYPYYLVVGYLTKLSHGVDVNGKHIEITRGKGGTRKEK